MIYVQFILSILTAIITLYAGSIQENKIAEFFFFLTSTLWWGCAGLILYKILNGA